MPEMSCSLPTTAYSSGSYQLRSMTATMQSQKLKNSDNYLNCREERDVKRQRHERVAVVSDTTT